MRNNNLRLAVFLAFVICSLSFVISDEVGAMGGPVPKPRPTGFLIDDFEDGNISVNTAWWVFDQVSPEVVGTESMKEGDAKVAQESGAKSLLIKGGSKNNWYAGGLGCYFARPGADLSSFRNLQMDVYGYGPGQGTLKIELFDDDNGNWELEQNTSEAFAPMYDDRFSTELLVDWVGWKRLVIPFSSFREDNPNVGNDYWDVDQRGGSGGLLQLQFIAISSRKVGTLQYAVDNIRLTK